MKTDNTKEIVSGYRQFVLVSVWSPLFLLSVRPQPYLLFQTSTLIPCGGSRSGAVRIQKVGDSAINSHSKLG